MDRQPELQVAQAGKGTGGDAKAVANANRKTNARMRPSIPNRIQ